MFLANWLLFLILACRCCILLKRYCTVKLALLKHQQSVLLLYLYLSLQGVHSINYLQEYDITSPLKEKVQGISLDGIKSPYLTV